MAVVVAGVARGINFNTFDLEMPLVSYSGRSSGTSSYYKTLFYYDDTLRSFMEFVEVRGSWTYNRSPGTNPLLSEAIAGNITSYSHSLYDAPNTKLYDITGINVAIPNAERDFSRPGEFIFNGADQITGSPFADVLRGYAGDDLINGGAGSDTLDGGDGADTLNGGDGDDVITGGGGNDLIDGGDGIDAAVYSASSSNYTWGFVNGVLVVKDNRPFPVDGEDRLLNIERIVFSDRVVSLLPAHPAAAAAITNILRLTWAAPQFELAQQVVDSSATFESAISNLVRHADASTSVATLAYQFFTGKIPSAAGLDYLVSPSGPNPNNLNSTYYQNFNLENRYINFSVNLGKFGDGKELFASKFGALSLAEATKQAYATIFGSFPSDEKVAALITPRADYFAYYGQDGLNGIGTKAAMVGWLLAEAVKADVGLYSKSNDAFLHDLADGAQMSIDLIGVYGRAEYVLN